MPNAVPKEYRGDLSERGEVECVSGWELIRRTHLNTLFVGPPAFTRHLVDRLGPQLVTPILRIRPDEPIAFPVETKVGTMILQDVDELRLADQCRLLHWLDSASTRPRVISMARRPIIAKVTGGAFLPTLYYRLNVFYIDMTGVGSTDAEQNIPL